MGVGQLGLPHHRRGRADLLPRGGGDTFGILRNGAKATCIKRKRIHNRNVCINCQADFFTGPFKAPTFLGVVWGRLVGVVWGVEGDIWGH